MNETIGIIPRAFRRRGVWVACTLLLRAGLNFLGLAMLLPVLALVLCFAVSLGVTFALNLPNLTLPLFLVLLIGALAYLKYGPSEKNNVNANTSGVAALLLAYLMPSLRRMFTTGSAVALALFTALAAVLSVVAGLRSRSFTLGCLTFAGCCAALTVLFLLRSSWLTEGFSAVLSALCLFAPFEEFANSNFSIPTLVYYLTVTVLFLFFTVQELEKRRWN